MALLSRLTTRRSGTQVSSALVALALAALIAIVAVVAAGHRTGGGHTGAPSRAFADYLLTAFLVFMVVAAVAIAYVVWRERGDLLPQRTRKSRLRREVQALLILLGFAFALVLLRQTGFRPRGIFQRLAHLHPAPPAKTRAKHGAATPPAAHDPHFRWIAAALVVALVAGVVLLAAYVAARNRLAADERRRAAEEVAAALDDSVDDLRAEPDPRLAIVAAYARMERALAAVGVPRSPAEAPLEFMARALEELRASAISVRRLTELFRLAKFSAHALGGAEKEQAIDALVAIRDELRSHG